VITLLCEPKGGKKLVASLASATNKPNKTRNRDLALNVQLSRLYVNGMWKDVEEKTKKEKSSTGGERAHNGEAGYYTFHRKTY